MSSLTTTVASSIGSEFIGLILSSITLGISFTQSYSYFYQQPEDRWILKLSVAAMLVTSVLTEGALIASVWHYLIWGRDLGNLVLLDTPRIDGVWLLAPAVSCTISQTFLAYRCYKVYERSLLLLLYLAIMVFSTFASQVAVEIWILYSRFNLDNPKILIQLIKHEGIYPQVPLWLGATTDTSISLLLAYKLWKGKTGKNIKMDKVLERLMRMTLGTATLTSLFISLAAVCLAVSKNSPYLVFFIQLPNLYLLSVVYCLNARHTLSAFVNDSCSPKPSILPFHFPDFEEEKRSVIKSSGGEKIGMVEISGSRIWARTTRGGVGGGDARQLEGELFRTPQIEIESFQEIESHIDPVIQAPEVLESKRLSRKIQSWNSHGSGAYEEVEFLRTRKEGRVEVGLSLQNLSELHGN